MYNCIVFSNDILTSNALESYINESEEMVLNAKFNDFKEALSLLKQHPIDLFFIDIDNLQEKNDFGLLTKLDETIKVIFVSHSPIFALKAFNYLVIDYLLKPISEERFAKTIEKVKYMTFSLDTHEKLNELAFHKVLMVQSGQKKWKIQSQNIILIESIGEYVKIYCTNQMIVSLGALKDFQKELPKEKFVRVHKSFIIALDYIRHYNSREIKLFGYPTTVPIGRKFKNDFKIAIQTIEL